jgi:hypothetical protein
VKQDNPERTYKGSKEDTIGPGHYETKNCLANLPKKGGDFHMSKVKERILNEYPLKE